MGESALKSDAKGEKHKQNSRHEGNSKATLSSYWFGSSAGTSTCSSAKECVETSQQQKPSLTVYSLPVIRTVAELDARKREVFEGCMYLLEQGSEVFVFVYTLKHNYKLS